MKSVFSEIEKLSCDCSIDTDIVRLDRFTVIGHSRGRLKTAYCFSVPIYNQETNHLVNMKFYHRENESLYVGSNAKVLINDSVRLQNQYGCCELSFFGKISMKTETTISWVTPEAKCDVSPTLNGLLFKIPAPIAPSFSLTLRRDPLFETVKSNDKFFSIMREAFIPFVTVSCIGVLNDRGNVIAPCDVHYQSGHKGEYNLTFTTRGEQGSYIAFEINMQDVKLFQDTTVESQQPKLNNVFGGTAFLGKTRAFGEQWLYSRLELSNLPRLQNKKIIGAILHVPMLNEREGSLVLNHIAERFCSFGSTWENKIPITESITESIYSKGYYHFDVKTLFDGVKRSAQNFAIKVNDLYDISTVISTGDSFYHPQVLEVTWL